MRALNEVKLIGNLGRDPETKTFDDGNSTTTFSVATSESWKDKTTGEKKEKTEWHRCVCWRQIATIASTYLKKGSKVYVSGSLQTRQYTDKGGVEKYSTEIVVRDMIMLDGKDVPQDGRVPEAKTFADAGDDLPF
tara:strand:+ start:2450 stop:2854 length:405 start_codon:yes stop_codon:yes gene_type:complete